MFIKTRNRLKAAAISAAVIASALTAPMGISNSKIELPATTLTAEAADTLSISDLPSNYQYAADWIWNNRISAEKSTERRNTIFDQIVAGKGTINYVVRWQSYKTVTLAQRQQFEVMLEKSINEWTDWLVGYENWPYQHIDVKIVGWAVIDKSCLLDLQPDEIVYTDTEYYDSTYDTPNGYETIPDRLPNAPSSLSRFDHFTDKNYSYPGGLDKRFDMYMWATEGFPSIGGCGGDWGQRLSDSAYLNMLDGSAIHVFEHELGHGFGMTDFYGGEGASDGFPPGGFPGNGSSLMMAGSSAVITDFDGWMLRYMWTKIKDDSGRFTIETPVVTTTTTAPVVTTTTAAATTKAPTVTTTTASTPNGSSKPAAISKADTTTWELNVDSANAVELTFSGAAYGGANGVLGYWSDSWNTIDWEERIDENGTMKVYITLPEGLGDVKVQKYYAAVWDNDLGDMKDIEIELESAVLYYGSSATTTPITTTTPAATTTIPLNSDVQADIIKGENAWSFEANKANSVTLVFEALPYAYANGAMAYWSDAWTEDAWEGEFSADGKLSVTLPLPAGLGTVQVQKYYAAVYSNELGDMVDIDVDLVEVILHYGQSAITTTTTATTSTTAATTAATTTAVTTTTKSTAVSLYGDANCDGDVDMGDAVAILKYLADPVGCALTEQGKLNGDVEQNGNSIDSSDALAIQKLRAKQISTLPESYYKK